MVQRQMAPDDFEPEEAPYGGVPLAWSTPDDTFEHDDLSNPFFDPRLEDHMAQLASMLDFTPADLEANRHGMLSPDQVRRLENDLRWLYWPVIGGACLVMLLLMLAGLSGGSIPFVPVTFLAVIAVGAAFMLYQARTSLPHRRVRASELRMGQFALVTRRWGLVGDDELRPQYPVETDKRVFAPQQLAKVLRARQTYRVYFSPVWTWGGHRMLSLEPVGEREAPERRRRKRKPKIKAKHHGI